MTAFVLITGALTRKPELRRARNGRPFVTAKIRMSDDGGNYSYWAINAFDEGVAQALLSCAEGDLIAARGKLRLEIYAPEGKPARINATCSANGILNLSLDSFSAKARAGRMFKQKALPFPDDWEAA